VIQFRSIDNPEYPREEYEKAKATLPDWLFAMRYEGRFRKPSGLVYPEFGERLFVEPFEIPPDWPVYVGLDPGAFFGALFLAWHDGVYYAFAEHYTEEVQPAEQHARALLERKQGTVLGWIYDPARLTDVVELAQHGIGPLVQANNAVLPGIMSATAVIKSGRLKVMRGRCPNFVDQMESYRFPTDPATGEVTGELPVKRRPPARLLPVRDPHSGGDAGGGRGDGHLPRPSHDFTDIGA
jgi:Terminase-like family.